MYINFVYEHIRYVYVHKDSLSSFSARRRSHCSEMRVNHTQPANYITLSCESLGELE